MQKLANFTEITPTADVAVERHGARAKCLQRLMRLEMPVPRTVAIPFKVVSDLASGTRFDTTAVLSVFGPGALMSVRPSAETPDWGGPTTILNIGMNHDAAGRMAETLGGDASSGLFRRFVQSFAVEVARLDPEEFPPGQTLEGALEVYRAEMDEPFPEDPARQLSEVLGSMARAWDGTSARLLRQAGGAPADAGLGLVVQRMAIGLGRGVSGSGVIQFVDGGTGEPRITGRYKRQAQGREELTGEGGAMFLAKDPRGPSLEDEAPEVLAELTEMGSRARRGLHEEMQIEFTVEDGSLAVLDAVRVTRGSRGAVRIAVDLAADGVIGRNEALMRLEPGTLSELLHPQVAEGAERDLIVSGVAASPGAATGKVALTATAAQAMAAQGEAAILVRQETSPEDIRGMHASVGVLTERGGVTSHAAMIARGLGLPCVVGANGLRIDVKNRTVTAGGRTFSEGGTLTVDGSRGEVLAGAPEMTPAVPDEHLRTFMDWAVEVSDIAVRANADTPQDAQTARRFRAGGIGLCRTEHMFFEDERLTAMREMIFAEKPEDRRAALERLLPMQRDDFSELFRIMEGLPVCIRLFDPPLHEFLPKSREGVRQLAEAMDLPVSRVAERVDDLSEFNPMLGMRGVRLGITVPEIYDTQARAIFEAASAVGGDGPPVAPEIMIPLVSAKREVEMVKRRIDAVASAVRSETGADFDYSVGVMVETPRAALRAAEIAQHADFFSFGTNDLTQMTYGLSRDDAGRFMGAYVGAGVFHEDPFHSLDLDGVGELLKTAAARGRKVSPNLTLSICGEHGGDADSIAFCRANGFDYVSCSPFRVPAARLAAAQVTILDQKKEEERPIALAKWLRSWVKRNR